MDLKTLKDTPPWDWPDGTAEKLVSVLRDEQAAEPARVRAAEMAGDFTVVNDELVEALLAVLRNSKESKEMRARAAISLGPILEYADTEGLDDPDGVPISERTFRRIQESLRELYMDVQIPSEVRRRILEASVRAPQEWRENAVRAAYASGDDARKLTAVFCMRFVRGFNEQIVEELDNRIQPFISRLSLPQETGASEPRGHTSLPSSIRAGRPNSCFWPRLKQYPTFAHRKPVKS